MLHCMHVYRNPRVLMQPGQGGPRLSVDVRCNSGGDVQQSSATVRRSNSANMGNGSSRLGRGVSNISDSSHSGVPGVETIVEDPNILQQQQPEDQQDASGRYHGQRQILQHQAPLGSPAALTNISENEGRGPLGSRKVPRQSSGLLLRPLGFLGDFGEHVPMRWEAQLLTLGHMRGTAESSSPMNSLAPEPSPAELSSTLSGNLDFPGDWAWHSIEASSIVDPITGKQVSEWGCACEWMGPCSLAYVLCVWD